MAHSAQAVRDLQRARQAGAAAPRRARARARLAVLERVLGVVQLGRQVRISRVGRVAAQEGAVRLQVRADLLQLLRGPAVALTLGFGVGAGMLRAARCRAVRVDARERGRQPPGARPAALLLAQRSPPSVTR